MEFSKEWQCIDGRAPLGKEYVGVIVCEVFSMDMTLASHTLQRWPIKNTLYEGVSLYNQERKYNEILQTKAERMGERQGSRQYFSRRKAMNSTVSKRKHSLVQKSSIFSMLRSTCCKRKCIGQFSRALIKTLRYEMHHVDNKSKDSIRLVVHRSFHYEPQSSKKVCVVEGKAICMPAWRMIYGVSKTDFYRYRAYAGSG